MSPLNGIAAGAAGSPLAQTKGSEVERARAATRRRQRAGVSWRKAEAAAGVGQPDGEDHEATERDADGRRAWEEPPETERMPARRTCGRAKTRRIRAETCWI